jgi:FkbM family methyltransferase
MPDLTQELISELLRDSHRYVPAIEPRRPTLNSTAPSLRRGLVRTRHRVRNLVEQAAARTGFARRHYEAEVAAAQLTRILAIAEELERTVDLLGDEESRRAVLDVLKLRVLGPYHAPLRVTPDRFRAMQSFVDRTMLREPATFEVDDPWFSPISLYEVPGPDGASISLHAHSVDIVSVFLLDQYSYRSAHDQVAAATGDVVIDGGACWGDTALYLACLVGPAGKIYSFEFDPQNLEIMRTNLTLNPELAERIEVVEKALWDRSDERLEFALGGRTTSVVAPRREPQLAATTITVDDFVAARGLEHVDFIKMDIEGAEAKALLGARSTLERWAPRLALAAYHEDDDLVALPRAIEPADRAYRYFVHTCSPLEEETVLFASEVRSSVGETPAVALRNST